MLLCSKSNFSFQWKTSGRISTNEVSIKTSHCQGNSVTWNGIKFLIFILQPFNKKYKSCLSIENCLPQYFGFEYWIFQDLGSNYRFEISVVFVVDSIPLFYTVGFCVLIFYICKFVTIEEFEYMALNRSKSSHSVSFAYSMIGNKCCQGFVENWNFELIEHLTYSMEFDITCSSGGP